MNAQYIYIMCNRNHSTVAGVHEIASYDRNCKIMSSYILCSTCTFVHYVINSVCVCACVDEVRSTTVLYTVIENSCIMTRIDSCNFTPGCTLAAGNSVDAV